MNPDSTVIYLAQPHVDQTTANQLAKQQGAAEALAIGRRGYQVGWIAQGAQQPAVCDSSLDDRWPNMDAILLPGLFKNSLAAFKTDIERAQCLSQAILDGTSCDDLLAAEPYASRLATKFELLAANCNESDAQEIETLDFDVMEGKEIIAEGLWVKLSWLSLIEEDTSLRFRFSFGIAGYEDVAADYQCQSYAAELTEAIFPQSAIISKHVKLQSLLSETLGVNHVDYVERIIYFNAPQGGAQFHQDVERGHLGVVFAQLHGRTAWLALAKQQLVTQILAFMASDNAEADYLATVGNASSWQTLLAQTQNRERLNFFLDEDDNDAVELLINRVPRFSQQLVEKGYAFILNPGDAILLPQLHQNNCCWHSVFCLDDFPGQALSFAIRPTPNE